MSFLDNYIADNKLPPLDQEKMNTLEKVEATLNNLTPGKDQFDDIIKDNAEQINQIIEEIKIQFVGWKPSVGSFVSSFRFVIDIATEVVKIISDISGKIVPAGATSEQAHQAKIEFGKELTYFIYVLLGTSFSKWIPDWIEKKIIYWLAGMTIDWALDKIEGNRPIAKSLNLKTKKKITRTKKGTTKR